ncbi:hypothetical protein [Pelagicoccus mobilis]|uniref:Glycosyltransferase n=1 Tax=Pelagicoccus mobilis TaxID=415221 RepID=A0A934S1G1_9BACT|nr:hypothetical protein [Pelagicoccus mobilis]MBK1880592.1 hypothetical protein [Pelagicoccus mobilis]
MRNVICMKWGTRYGPEYVNRLKSMVKRHLSYEHRFVCFTDRAEGIDEDVEVLPLPELDLPEGAPERGWNKLTMFPEKLHDLEGDTLFLDLDVVILDSIDPFFEEEGDFLIINDWKYPRRVTGNSSVFRFRPGAHPYVLDYFLNNLEEVRKNFRNEQAYLSDQIHQHGKLKYWPVEWCVSFKYHCMPKFPLNYFIKPTCPPGTRIAIFHGNPKLQEALEGTSLTVRRYCRPAKWVEENWR